MMFRDILEMQTVSSKYYMITKKINEIVGASTIKDGICHISVVGTTAAIILNENDEMLLRDMRNFMDFVAKEDKLYAHPHNAFSHLRSSLFGTEKSVPVANGQLLLGEWQDIIFWELDTRPRKRQIVVTIQGD